MKNAMGWILGGVGGGGGGGGGGEWEGADATSDAVFYTKKVNEHDSGAVTFTDEKSNTKVTIQSSQIQEISKDDYNAAIGDE